MNKIKKTLLIFFCFPIISIGQEKSLELGLLMGGSYNSIPKNPRFNEETLRPMGGILIKYNFTQLFSIKSKLAYQIKGGATANAITGSGDLGSNKIDYHCLSLPLLAQLNFGKNKWGVFCNTGAYLDYLMKAELIDSKGDPSSVLIDGINVGFGVSVGSGITFRFSERLKIFLESSFNYGHLQSITASAGLTYNLQKKKKTFNGTDVLDCTDYEEAVDTKQKKKTKWRLVLYKDGKKIGGKKKKGKSRLFKRKKK